jgi:hypothetical protein
VLLLPGISLREWETKLDPPRFSCDSDLGIVPVGGTQTKEDAGIDRPRIHPGASACGPTLGLALMAMLVLSATAVATASAEQTKILPEPTTAAPLTFVDSQSAAGELLTLAKSKVECKKGTSSGEFTTSNLGKYKVTFTECKGPLGTTCTGTGDAAGEILQAGTVHYVLAKLGTTLVGALVFLVTQFHFVCKVSTIEQLVLVRGCIAALAKETEKLVTETEDLFLFTAAGSGDPDIKTFLPEGTEKEVSCVLESSINGGAFESSALSATDKNKEFKKGGVAVTVLLHNK